MSILRAELALLKALLSQKEKCSRAVLTAPTNYRTQWSCCLVGGQWGRVRQADEADEQMWWPPRWRGWEGALP